MQKAQNHLPLLPLSFCKKTADVLPKTKLGFTRTSQTVSKIENGF